MHWIENNENQLEKFVQAITGIRTLSAQKLTIKLFDSDSTRFPVAHTCFFSLDLPVIYKNQKDFNQKINDFLVIVLADSGFTLD